MNIHLAECTSFEALQLHLQDVDFSTLTGSQYRAIYRCMRGFERPALRIAYLGNQTLDMLHPYVAVQSIKPGITTQSYLAAFGQYFQALSDAQLKEFSADVIVLVLSLRLLREHDIANFSSLTSQQRYVLKDEILQEVETWALEASNKTQATLLIANFSVPDTMAMGIATPAEEFGELEFYLTLNLELMQRMRNYRRVRLLDVNRLASRIGHQLAFDERLFHLAKFDWTERMLMEVGNEIARHLVAATGATHKCLVVDLDNTLWGGILGEDGVHGVKVGHGDAESEAFQAFQYRIKAISQRGILLAICSKNNLEDVQEMFESRSDMPLSLQDFSAYSINWESKHIGLATIATQLNIGLDSLVFVDDNPTEVALVRSQLPQVKSILLPADPSRFSEVLDGMLWFEKGIILQDDLNKLDQYRSQAARQAMSEKSATLDDYLSNLQIVLNIRDSTVEDVNRVHQLFSKTNQFNLTTKRYSLGEIEAAINSVDQLMRIVGMEDRFGDLGIIGVYLLCKRDSTLYVDSLLMSCRALGRGVETAIFNGIKQFAIDSGFALLTADYKPTAKNIPAKDYLASQGMTLAEVDAQGIMHYVLRAQEIQLQHCDWLLIKKEPIKKTSMLPSYFLGSGH